MRMNFKSSLQQRRLLRITAMKTTICMHSGKQYEQHNQHTNPSAHGNCTSLYVETFAIVYVLHHRPHAMSRMLHVAHTGVVHM